MGNGFDSDEQQGRQAGDPDDLEPSGGTFRESGCPKAVLSGQRANRAYRDARDQKNRQADHEADGKPAAADAKESDPQEDGGGQQDAARIHITAENRVPFSERKRVPQEKPGKKRERRGIRPQQGKIDQREEPGYQKTVIISENLPGVGVRAARFRESAHQIGVVPADHPHHGSAGQQAQQGSPKAGSGQESAAADDQGTTARAGADSKSPASGGRQAGRQPGGLSAPAV